MPEASTSLDLSPSRPSPLSISSEHHLRRHDSYQRINLLNVFDSSAICYLLLTLTPTSSIAAFDSLKQASQPWASPIAHRYQPLSLARTVVSMYHRPMADTDMYVHRIVCLFSFSSTLIQSLLNHSQPEIHLSSSPLHRLPACSSRLLFLDRGI